MTKQNQHSQMPVLLKLCFFAFRTDSTALDRPSRRPAAGKMPAPHLRRSRAVLQVEAGCGVKRILLWLIVALIVVIALMLYRSRQQTHPNIAPDAEREIEKAKRK